MSGEQTPDERHQTLVQQMGQNLTRRMTLLFSCFILLGVLTWLFFWWWI